MLGAGAQRLPRHRTEQPIRSGAEWKRGVGVRSARSVDANCAGPRGNCVETRALIVLGSVPQINSAICHRP